MRTPELERIILKQFGKREFYGYDVHRRLEKMGHRIGMTRLYRVLGKMLQEGLLQDKWIKSETGPKRRVYQITEAGLRRRNQILLDAIATVHEFYLEYIGTFPPEKNRTQLLSKFLTDLLPTDGVLGCLVYDISSSQKYLLKVLDKITQDKKKYLICGQKIEETEIGNWLRVHGNCSDIPLKKESVDLLLIPGLRNQYCEGIVVEECSRVLRTGGTLAFLTPAALLKNSKEVMTIGEFVEFWMHQGIEGHIPITLSELSKQLSYCFETIRVVEFGDLVLVLASEKS